MTTNPCLDDTSRCPIAPACEVCGSTYDLRTVTVGTVVGVYCVTLCAADRVRPVANNTSAPAAVRRSQEHCAHLGIDADQMAAALDDEAR